MLVDMGCSAGEQCQGTAVTAGVTGTELLELLGQSWGTVLTSSRGKRKFGQKA